MAEENLPSEQQKTKPNDQEDSSASASNRSRKQKILSGVQFPVDQIRKKLKQGQYSDKVGGGSAVYMAAVLEYLTAEFLEVAGNQTPAGPNKRIVPHHLKLAAQKDEELAQLLCASPPVSTPALSQTANPKEDDNARKEEEDSNADITTPSTASATQDPTLQNAAS